MERRLAAILAADVVGYSRLIREDEASTLAALKAHREELIEPKLAQYHGRIVKLMGDGLLTEFPSAVEAVQCAVEMQHLIGERNADVPEDKRIIYRIGINIGDIVVEDDDIYGDGVNVAARLEGLADPGGICVARNAYDQVKDKLDLTFEHLGEKEVKNIAEPVTVYRVALDEKAAELVTPVIVPPAAIGRRHWPQIAAALAVLVIVASGVLWWRLWAPDIEPASVERTAFAPPDQPSIAVLPFMNMSNDPEQEYFADGITDDLITDLSKISGLLVIARNSTFAYKGKPVDARQIAAELGVRYVMEGSVRRADDTVRINAQLIDATTGGHVWAERYDRSLIDIFALQDEVIKEVLKALRVYLTTDEQEREAARETESLEAYDAFLRAKEHIWAYTKEDYAIAIANLRKAVELDPNYTKAHGWLAVIYWETWSNDWQSILELSSEEVLKKAKHHLDEARKDPTEIAVYQLQSSMLSDEGRFDEAIIEAEKILALDPNSLMGHGVLARALNKAGRFNEGLEVLKKLVKLDPKGSEWGWHSYRLGESLYHTERYDEAAKTFQTYTQLFPKEEWGYFYLAASYGQLGDSEKAKTALDTFEEIRSKSGHEPYTLARIDGWTFKYDADRERFREGLRGAGVPE
jgi:TolB-like protein/class 3 adenylate cyclase/thioredoxin-like negative regulator of GroEL